MACTLLAKGPPLLCWDPLQGSFLCKSLFYVRPKVPVGFDRLSEGGENQPCTRPATEDSARGQHKLTGQEPWSPKPRQTTATNNLR